MVSYAAFDENLVPHIAMRGPSMADIRLEGVPATSRHASDYVIMLQMYRSCP